MPSMSLNGANNINEGAEEGPPTLALKLQEPELAASSVEGGM